LISVKVIVKEDFMGIAKQKCKAQLDKIFKIMNLNQIFNNSA
jgi:hypothetical protein